MADERVGVELIVEGFTEFNTKLGDAKRAAMALNSLHVGPTVELKGIKEFEAQINALARLANTAGKGGAAGSGSGMQAVAAQARVATREIEKSEAAQRRLLDTSLRGAQPSVALQARHDQEIGFINDRLQAEKNLTSETVYQANLRKEAITRTYQQAQATLAKAASPGGGVPPISPVEQTANARRLATLTAQINAQETASYRTMAELDAKHQRFTENITNLRAKAGQAEIANLDQLEAKRAKAYQASRQQVIGTGIIGLESQVSDAGIRVGRSYEVFEKLRMEREVFTKEATDLGNLEGATAKQKEQIAGFYDRRIAIFEEEQARAQKQIGNRIRQESFEKSFMGQLASAESRTYGARILASEMQRMGMSMVLGAVGVEMFAQKQTEKYLTEFRQPLGRVQRALDLTDPQKEFLDTTLLQRAGKESMVPAADAATAMRVWSEAINTVVDSEKDLYDASSQTGLVIQTELITNLVKLNEGTATVDQTVTDVAAIMTQFGLVEADAAEQTANLTEVVALLDTAAASGLANVNDIGASLKFFAGRAHDLGVALPEAVASIEMLAQVGLKGSQSGRGMDQLIKSMVAPTPKAVEAFSNLIGEDWQAAFFDMSTPEQQFKGLANFLQEMADATENMSVMERQAEFAALGDANAIRTLNALILRTIEARRMGIEMGYGEVDYLKTLTQLREQGSAGLENELKVLEAVAGIDFGDLSAVDSFQKRLVELKADIATLYSQSVIQLETSFLSLGKSLSSTVVPAFEKLAGAMTAIADIFEKYPNLGKYIVTGGAIIGALGVATLASSAVIRAAVNFQTVKMALTGAGGIAAVAGSLTGKSAMGLSGATERQIAALVTQGIESKGAVVLPIQQEAVAMAARMSKTALSKAEIAAVSAAAAASGAVTGQMTKKAVQAALASARVGSAGAAVAEAGVGAAVGSGAWVAEVGVKAAAAAAVTGLLKAMLSIPVLIATPVQKMVSSLAQENAKQYVDQQKTDVGRTVATVLRSPDLARLPMGANPLGPLGGSMQAYAAGSTGIYRLLDLLGIDTVAGLSVPKSAPTADQWEKWAYENAVKPDLFHQVLAGYQYSASQLGVLPDKIGKALTDALKGPLGLAILTRGGMASDELQGTSWTRSFKALWALMPWTDNAQYQQRRDALQSGSTWISPAMQTQYLNANARNVQMQYFPAPSPKTKAEWAKQMAEVMGGVFDVMPDDAAIQKYVDDLTSKTVDAAAAMTEAGVPAERISAYLSTANDYISRLAANTDGAYSSMVGLAIEASKVAKHLADSAAEMTALANLRSGSQVEAARIPLSLQATDIAVTQAEYIKQAESMRAELVKTGEYSVVEAAVLYDAALEEINTATNEMLTSQATQLLDIAGYAAQEKQDPDIAGKAEVFQNVGLEIVRAVLDGALATLQGVLSNAKLIEAGKKEFDKNLGKMRSSAQAARESLADAALTPDQRAKKGLDESLATALYGLVPGSEAATTATKNYNAALAQVGASSKKAAMTLQDVATKWRSMIESALDTAKGLSVTDKQWNQTLGMQGGPPEDQGDSNKSKMWSALSAAIGPYVDTAWEPLRRLASAANDPNTKWAGMLPGGVGPGTPQAQAYFSFVQDRVNAFDPAFSEFFPDKKKLLEGIMGDLAGQGRKEQFITDVVAEGAAMGLDEATLRKYFEDPQAQLDKTMGLLDGSIAVSRTSTDNLKDSMDKSKTAVDDSTSATIGLTAVMEKFIPPAPPDGEKPPPPPPPDPNAAKKGDGGYEAFAKGGLVTRPTFALIGEAGPELIIPLGKSGGFTSKGFIAPTQIMLQSISPQIGQLNLNTTVNGAPSQLARNLVHTQKAAARNLGFEILRLAAREGA